MPKTFKIRSINAKKAKSKKINIVKNRKKWYMKTDSNLLICWISTSQSGEPKRRWQRKHPRYQRYPTSTVALFLVTLNTTCIWSKWSATKNILSIARAVNLEATTKLWGIEYWRKRCKERTRWTISKAFPVVVDCEIIAGHDINNNRKGFAYSSSCPFLAPFSSVFYTP